MRLATARSCGYRYFKPISLLSQPLFGAANCQEAVDIMDALVTLANAHLPTGVAAITAPLVQSDVPT